MNRIQSLGFKYQDKKNLKSVRPAAAHFFLLMVLFAITYSSAFAGQEPEWVKIGEKKVNRKLDRDEIPVLNSSDLFTALQFRVTRSSANIARCSIHFENGKVKNVKLGQNIEAGGESRIIKFGIFGARAVAKVVVWYDTMDNSDKKAVVEVWCRQ